MAELSPMKARQQARFMNKRKLRDISQDEKSEIKGAFELFDADKDGLIDYHELKVSMKALGFDVKKADALKILQDYEGDHPGKLNFECFNEVASDMVLSRDPNDELRKAFKLFDDDSTGKISIRNLRRVVRDLGEEISDEELRAMIDEFDFDKDGEISQEEFIKIMTEEYWD